MSTESPETRGKKPMGRRRVLTEDQVAEAAQLYAEGWGLGKLGWLYGVSHMSVKRALERVGVTLRPPPAPIRPRWRDPIWGSLAWLMYRERGPGDEQLPADYVPKVRVDLGSPGAKSPSQKS
jgi:hypothetical protein